MRIRAAAVVVATRTTPAGKNPRTAESFDVQKYGRLSRTGWTAPCSARDQEQQAELPAPATGAAPSTATAQR